MTDRLAIKVKIVDRSVYGSLIDVNNYGADRIVDLIAWLQGILEEIPEECRDRAFIEIDSEGGYEGEHHVEMSLCYQRDETDSEMEKRIASDAQRAETGANQRLAHERATFDRLKAKFEGTGQ